MEKKFSELEEGVDYIDLDKRSFAERLPEIVEKEAIKGPRWIVVGGCTLGDEDEWIVCESLEEADKEYKKMRKDFDNRIHPQNYVASITAVVRSTDYDLVSSEEFSQAKLFLAGTPE